MPPGVAPVPDGWTLRHLLLPGEEDFGTYAVRRKDAALGPMARDFWEYLAKEHAYPASS